MHPRGVIRVPIQPRLGRENHTTYTPRLEAKIQSFGTSCMPAKQGDGSVYIRVDQLLW